MKRRWVEVDVGRLLNRCETDGVRLVHCSPYIREWMSREQKNDPPNKGDTKMRAVQLTAYGDLSRVLSMSTFPCPRLRVRKILLGVAGSFS